MLLVITANALKLSHYRVNWSDNESAKSRNQALTLKLSGIKTTIDCFMSLCESLLVLGRANGPCQARDFIIGEDR